jgi:hypothetical protein
MVLSVGETHAQAILPPAQDAIGGGNPLQGLGRKDDPSPPRYQDYLPKNQLSPSILDSANSSGSSESDGSSESTGAIRGSSLDSSGLKLEDVPKMINKLQEQSAAVAGEAGIGMGNNNDAAPGGGDIGSALSRTGSGGSPTGEAGLGNAGEESSFQAGPSLATPLGGSSLTGPSLATPLTPPPQDSGSESRISADGSNQPQSLNAAGEFENGSPSGLPPGPGVPLARTTAPRSPGTVSVQTVQNRARAHTSTGNSQSSLVKPLQQHNAPAASKNGLVPPPPPTAFSSHSTGATSMATPEREALQLIRKGEYGAAEDQLRSVVSADPLNLHARYLLAVALVYRKNYDEARAHYSTIIQKSQDSKLVELATEGLRKIAP